MPPRMASPVMVVPDALQALPGLSRIISKAWKPNATPSMRHRTTEGSDRTAAHPRPHPPPGGCALT